MKFTLLLLLIFSILLTAPNASALSRLPLQLPEEFVSERTSIQKWILPGQSIDLVDLEGAGAIRHMWTTFNGAPDNMRLGRQLILEISVDGSEEPQVRAPLSAIFGHFHDVEPGRIVTPFIQVTENGGLNSYVPIPFGDGIRATIINESQEELLAKVFRLLYGISFCSDEVEHRPVVANCQCMNGICVLGWYRTFVSHHLLSIIKTGTDWYKKPAFH